MIDLDSGDAMHWLWIDGSAHERYDVAVLPGVALSKTLGFQSHEIRRNLWFEDEQGRAGCWSGVERR